MKTFKKQLMVALSVLAIATSGVALAQSDNAATPQAQEEQMERKGRHMKRGHGGFGKILHQQLENDMYQVRIAAVAELSGQSLESIQERLKSQPLRSIARELDLERDDMHKKMQEAMPELIKKAAADGRITQEQETMILEQLEENPNAFMGGKRGGRHGKRGGHSKRG